MIKFLSFLLIELVINFVGDKIKNYVLSPEFVCLRGRIPEFCKVILLYYYFLILCLDMVTFTLWKYWYSNPLNPLRRTHRYYSFYFIFIYWNSLSKFFELVQNGTKKYSQNFWKYSFILFIGNYIMLISIFCIMEWNNQFRCMIYF